MSNDFVKIFSHFGLCCFDILKTLFKFETGKYSVIGFVESQEFSKIDQFPPERFVDSVKDNLSSIIL